MVEGDVLFDHGSLALYSTDASIYRHVPIGVVRPRHAEDVIRAVALARENGVPVLARGGGTSLAGQACNAALVLDCSRYMDGVRSIDVEGAAAVVKPGVIQSRLNAAASSYGLFFPPDPATKDRCTLGGMIGNNSCGAHSAFYGKTVDNLIGIDFLLYDGTRLELGPKTPAEVERIMVRGGRVGELYRDLRALEQRSADLVRARYPRIPRRVSGYNLDELLPENGFNLARAVVGSEGTLGVVLGATVKLVRRPGELVLVVLGFTDIFTAADQVPWILEHRPEALEALPGTLVDLAHSKGVAGVGLLPSGAGFLIVELGGETRDEARERGERLVGRARQLKECEGVSLLEVRSERDAVWGLRESGLGSGAPIPGWPRLWPGTEDCAVPPAKLGQYLRRFDALVARRGLRVPIYFGHFGEGCVHCRVTFDLASARGIEIFRATMTEMAELVVEFGGSISGEHGDGRRSELLPTIFGPELIAAFREFKRIFDPEGGMNPGIIVDPLPLDDRLRQGAAYRPRPVETYFDFNADDGLAGAALRCVGIGKCRKLESGAMCPSYMATREELYSTRGRAHLLFEALTGDLLPGGFSDEVLHDSLGYCLSCKACKSECPAAVDMALYKSEFLAHYYRKHWRPLAAQFIGRIDRCAGLASTLPRLSNALAASFAGHWLKRAAGMHPARPLPQLARRTFRSWFADHAAADSSAREVVLFADCFTNYFDPEVAIAGVSVLEAAGFRVVVPARKVCCGRPLYDQGMLDPAKQRLEQVMGVLAPYAERGLRIVGLEPGCILTFRDELPRLFPRDLRAGLLAQNSFLLDEFLSREASGFLPAGFPARALFHAHCHQKAIVGVEHELALLRTVPGLKLEELDSGCCGMAGAFGYERDKFELSRVLAERVLLPAIRKGGAGTIVIADGFSCRSQVRCFCPDTPVVHLAQVLAPGAAGARSGGR